MFVWLPTYQYTLAAYDSIPSIFGENIPTAEFGMISPETSCWDIEKKIAKFLMRTFTCHSTFFYVWSSLFLCLKNFGAGFNFNKMHHQQMNLQTVLRYEAL